MRHADAQTTFRRFRAPRGDRSVLFEPAWEQVQDVAAANRALGREWAAYDCQGRALGELARAAREELLDEAVRWTSAYRGAKRPALGASGPVYLAGHQPQLFHPGVWLKNFALSALARRHGAAAVNLLVDNDVARGVSVRVPGGTARRPFWTEMPLDRPLQALPYEERPVADPDLFASFGRRAAEQIAPLVAGPLVREFWPLAVERMRATGLLGASLAQARHLLEGRWGLETLEVPLSRVCRGEPFLWFVAHLLAHLPRLREAYNRTVGQYRRAHRIRNAAHPVPDLGAEGPWLEAPLWVWTADDPRRRPLFARRCARDVELSDRGPWGAALPLTPEAGAGPAAARLAELAHAGVQIRPRALMTTLWARLALGDLFVHGIGGAKYDQVTDGLIERFFGLAPPGVLVISATLLLPVEHRRGSAEQLRRVRAGLRELTWRPERYVDAEGPPRDARCACQSAAALIAEKERWLAAPADQDARRRFLEIRRLNEALQPWVEPRRRRLLEEQAEAEELLRAERVLSWREYAFCLYSEAAVRDFYASVLPGAR